MIDSFCLVIRLRTRIVSRHITSSTENNWMLNRMFTDQQTSQKGKEMIDRHWKKTVQSRGRKGDKTK